MQNPSNRDERVSVVKAFGIILMVLGHTGFCHFGNAVIYSFHMPLFFFCSGVCFKEEYLNDSVKFIIRKIRKLYLPYVLWGLFFLAAHNVLFRLNLYSDQFGYNGNVSNLYSLAQIKEKAKHIILSMTGVDNLLGAYWFLKSLFWASIISYCTFEILKNEWASAIFLLGFTCYASYYDFVLPLVQVGETEFYGALFIALGRLFKRKFFPIMNSPWMLLGLPVLILVAYYKPVGGMTEVSCISIMPKTIVALIGICLCFYVAMTVPPSIKHWFAYVGDNTMPIVTFHFLSFKLVTLIIVLFNRMPVVHLSEFPVIADSSKAGWWIAYFIVGISLPLFISWCFNRLKVYHGTCAHTK